MLANSCVCVCPWIHSFEVFKKSIWRTRWFKVVVLLLKDMFESVNEDVTDFQSIDFADLVAGLAGSAMDCLEVILKVEDAVTEIAKEPRRRPPRNISMCKAGIFQELMVLKRRNWNFETTEQSSRILERLMSNKNMHQNIVGLWYEEESSSPKSVDRKGCPIEA